MGLHSETGLHSRPGLLSGKRLLITGVLTEASIAFDAARLAQQEGAKVVLSSYGRVRRLTERIAARLPELPPVIELDVTNRRRPGCVAGARG